MNTSYVNLTDDHKKALEISSRSENSYGELRHHWGREPFPLIVNPDTPNTDLMTGFPRIRELVANHLFQCGAVLFRGFRVTKVEEFKEFANAFAFPLLGYEFGSTPRSRLSEGIYTSTEYPSHQSIPLHNEQAYTCEWPMKIWFHCVTAAIEGGATPIADSREIYHRIDPLIRKRFAEKGLMYLRNFGNGLDLPWSRVFNTEDRGEVEHYCRNHRIVCEWKDDGELRTRQICQAIARHPVTGEWVWFNQAHLFHVSALDSEIRESLLSFLDEDDLPRNVCYGDGTPIEDAELNEIRSVMDGLQLPIYWQSGDILMLDNMLTAHGRTPFKGSRKVVVAMAEPYRVASPTIQDL